MKQKILQHILLVEILLLPAICNSQSWYPLGSGSNAIIYAMCSDTINNIIYAGGDFTSMGSLPANHIAKWDGSSWSTLGNGLNNYAMSLLIYNGELYAGGSFDTADGIYCPNVAKWAGNTWSPVGNTILSTVYALGAFNGDLYASTNSKIYTLNGGIWVQVGNAFNWGAITAIKEYNGNLYAGGGFITVGGDTVNNIAELDSNNWVPVGSGLNDFVWALESFNGFLFAGGYFNYAGSLNVKFIAKWNGTTWSTVGSGMGAVVHALYKYNNALYAGGLFKWVGGLLANGIAKWNGATWSALGSGVKYAGGGAGDVMSITGLNGNIYIGGSFDLAGSSTVNNIAMYGVTTSSEVNQISDFRFQIQMQPNPTNGKFNMKILTDTEEEKPYQIKMYDIFGKMLFSMRTTKEKVQLDISVQPPGVYLMQIRSGNINYNTRIIRY